MIIKCMFGIHFMIALLLNMVAVLSEPSENSGNSQMSDKMFVHPFLAHMGIPDQKGEVSLRTQILQSNSNGDLITDLGLHIEAGLINRLGLHIRNDAFREEDFTEIMLQFAPWINKENSSGIAVFGQLDFPTAAKQSTKYKGLAGISGAFTIPNITNFNGALHYDFDETMVEFEGSFVFHVSNILFPIFESNGMLSEEMQIVNLLPSIKFRINPASAFGVGVGVPVTNDREFDIRGLATYEFVIGM